MLEIGTSYKGYVDIGADDPRLADFYADKTKNHFDLVENQYLVVRNKEGEPADRYKRQWRLRQSHRMRRIHRDKYKPR